MSIDNDQDFCARCGKAIWQHGVASVTVGDRSYCTDCDPLPDEPERPVPVEEVKPPAPVAPPARRVTPPPLPSAAKPPPLPGVRPPPLPTVSKPVEDPNSGVIDSDFCYGCNAGLYYHGVSSHEIDGKFYCDSCAKLHR